MQPRPRPPNDELVEKLIDRVFGYEDAPLFDRHTVSPVLLDEFARSEAVRKATWAFATEVATLWRSRYPGKPFLRLSKKTSGAPPSKVSSSASPKLHGGSQAGEASMTDSSSDQPAAQPQGSAPVHPEARAGAIPDAAPPAITASPVERKLMLTVPNARSGEPYRARVEGKDERGRPLLVTEVQVPATVGLVFDPATCELHGTPTLAGEHPLAVRWQDEHGATRSASLVLIVNANPRDLWKSVDADVHDPYFKPSEHSQRTEAADFRLAAGSKRGRSHAHAGTFRDDDFFVAHDSATGWSVLLVADGAGSAKSSRKGSALAADKAGGHLLAELTGDEGALIVQAVAAWEAEPATAARPLKDRLYQLFGKAAWSALRAIEEEAAAKSAPVKDYSTTLLCAVHRQVAGGVFVASFWLGDGAICAYGPPGQCRLMGKPDSGEFAGQTRFLDKAALSDSAALWERIDFFRHDGLTALMLMTDGISDPRFETDNGLADVAKWDSLWAELAPALAAAEPEKALVAWMDFFTPGHHDDRTIALLW